MSKTQTTVGNPAPTAPNSPEALVMAALAKLITGGDKGFNRRESGDVPITHAGDKIVLPANPQPMTIERAIETLEDIQEDQLTEIAIKEEIRGYHFLDGLFAFNRAMSEIFGWTKAVTVRTFFGPRPPVSMDIQVGPGENEIERVLAGRFEIPGVSGYLEVGSSMSDGVPTFVITGMTQKKFQPLFTALSERTRVLVRERSIFRARAFELKFDDRGNISQEAPRFLNVGDAIMPIFSEFVETSVEANILNPIRYSARCRELGIPLKRGILLEGPYGTGKTMLSKMAARTATENGWTFLKLADAKFLPQAMKFARQFQPAILFLEDMDEVTAGEDRNQSINEILNTLDGVDSKSAEVMVVFTSNHADNINQAMMRPGRLDAIIQISAPDASACLRLLDLYARDLLDKNLDYQPVADALAGTSSAVIREVVERAKLFQLSLDGADVTGSKMVLTPDALTHSVETMKRQMDLLAEKTPDETPVGELLVQEIVKRVAATGIDAEVAADFQKRLAHIEQHVCD